MTKKLYWRKESYIGAKAKRLSLVKLGFFVLLAILVLLIIWRIVAQEPETKSTSQSTFTEPVTQPVTETTTDSLVEQVAPETPTPEVKTSGASLQDVLDIAVAELPGTHMVVVQEIGGKQRTASINAERRTTTASTYKMFVAYVALSKSQQGEINLNKVVYNGKTIKQCIEIAILESENECIKAVGFEIGWQEATDYVNQAGYRSVWLNNFNPDRSFNGDKLVNAQDEAQFLVSLHQGQLLDQPNTSWLLGLMKQQIHRSGIPAGSGGAVVADKPGWLDDYYYHDAGLVYAGSSTYAVAILTEDAGGWTSVRSISQAIYTYMTDI